MNKTCRGLALLSLPFLLAGCLDFTEELTLRADESAGYRVEFGVHEDFVDEEEVAEIRELLQQVKAELEQEDHITRVEVDDWESGSDYHFELDLDVDHYRYLGQTTDEALVASGMGSLTDESGFRFETLDGDRLRVIRELQVDDQSLAMFRAIFSELIDREAGEGDDPFADRRMTVAINAPRVLEAEQDGEQSRASVNWSYPLFDDEAQIPAELRAVVQLNAPFPWLLLIPGVLSLGGVLWLRKKWERRWE